MPKNNKMSETPIKKMREVKSFVRRTGRVTNKQKLAFENFSEGCLFEYSANDKIIVKEMFSNNNPVVIEIGFGMGGSLVQMALENPTNNYIGIEVHKAGVGNILHEIDAQNVQNLRVISHDAVEVLKNMLDDESLSSIQIYFPDPWHKTKHNKRRLVNDENLKLFASKLKSGGIIHFASDWYPYAKDVLELLEEHASFKNQFDGYAPRPDWRPLTKFEQRGQRLDHKISDILFEKV